MITLILKYWRWILDILIVIAICIAFSYFDPFHMFRKAQLKQTANMVSSIKDIGQLVTAEYYGETLSYLTEDIEAGEIKLDTVAESFIYDLTNALDNIKKREPKKDDDYGKTEEIKDIQDIYKTRYKYLVLYFARKTSSNSKWNLWRIERWFKKGNISNLEDFLFNKLKADSPVFDTQTFIDFKKFYNKEQPNEATTTKENIILIARGTVKAGFDFSKLDERNFLYNSDKKQIRLYGITAQLLDTIINPWFIPQQGIPGYEFVNNPRGDNYAKVIEVKNKCRLKLVQQARNAGIIQQAHLNGKQVFQNFFAVLLNEPDISVTFNQMPNQELLFRIINDSIITIKEAIEVASVMDQYRSLYNISSATERKDIEFEQRIFINNLKTCRFINKTNPFFNLYALEYAKLDTLTHSLTKVENSKYIYFNDTLGLNEIVKKVFTNIRDTLKEKDLGKTSGYTSKFLADNSFWYPDTSLVFIKDFNSTLNLYGKSTGNLEILKLCYPDFNLKISDFDSISLIHISKVDSIVKKALKNSTWIYECEKSTVQRVETKNVRYQLESKPIKQFTRFIRKTISLN